MLSLLAVGGGADAFAEEGNAQDAGSIVTFTLPAHGYNIYSYDKTLKYVRPEGDETLLSAVIGYDYSTNKWQKTQFVDDVIPPATAFLAEGDSNQVMEFEVFDADPNNTAYSSLLVPTITRTQVSEDEESNYIYLYLSKGVLKKCNGYFYSGANRGYFRVPRSYYYYEVEYTIPASGVGTFSYTEPLQLVRDSASKGVKVSTLSRIMLSQDSVQFLETSFPGDSIPSNTGAIVRGTPNATITFQHVASEPAYYFANMMVPVSTEGNIYASTEEGYTYCYLSKGSVKKINSYYKSKANRAYIRVPSYLWEAIESSGAKTSLIEDEETTGIKTVNATDGTVSDRIYTINGLLVKHPQQKGIYIRNGKKFLVK